MANMLSIIKDGKVTPIFPDTKCGCDYFYVRSISLAAYAVAWAG